MTETKNEQIVEYILVAEFDIDKGSTIAFQYPQPCGEDTQLLAECMLPDGVHKRDEDWTIFFLGRPTQGLRSSQSVSSLKKSLTKEEALPQLEAFLYEYYEGSTGWDSFGSDKKIITLLSNGLKISSKDGELVTSVFKHPKLDFIQLEPLFSSVLTEAGTALGFRFINLNDEQQFLQHLTLMKSQIEEELLLLQQQQQQQQTIQDSEENTTTTTSTSNGEIVTSTNNTNSNNSTTEEERPFLYCLNLVYNQKDSSVRRGAVVKAMAVCLRQNYIHIFKPAIVLALHKFYQNRSEDVLAELYDALNAMDLSQIDIYSDHRKLIYRASSDKNKQEFTSTLKYQTKMNIKIPLCGFPDEVGDFKVTTLFKKFGPQIITIYNGLLSEKRILFLGFDCAAGEVCEYVLASIRMVCPPLKGFVKRAFPYVNLTHLDFLDVPGYIAGVTNPMFEHHTEWWDILCNINTGKIVLSAQLSNPQAQVQANDKHTPYDMDFMNNITNSVASHYGEEMIRTLFQNYTQHIVDMAFDEEEFPDEAAKLIELEANKQRIDTWKRTLTFKIYENDRKLRKEMSAIRDPNVIKYVKKLRISKTINEREMMVIYQCFLDNIKTEDQLVEFLALFPESYGGLISVAISLFHSSEVVRIATAKLLQRLDKIQTGTNLIKSINYFIYIAYESVSKLIDKN